MAATTGHHRKQRIGIVDSAECRAFAVVPEQPRQAACSVYDGFAQITQGAPRQRVDWRRESQRSDHIAMVVVHRRRNPSKRRYVLTTVDRVPQGFSLGQVTPQHFDVNNRLLRVLLERSPEDGLPPIHSVRQQCLARCRAVTGNPSASSDANPALFRGALQPKQRDNPAIAWHPELEQFTYTQVILLRELERITQHIRFLDCATRYRDDLQGDAIGSATSSFSGNIALVNQPIKESARSSHVNAERFRKPDRCLWSLRKQ